MNPKLLRVIFALLSLSLFTSPIPTLAQASTPPRELQAFIESYFEARYTTLNLMRPANYEAFAYRGKDAAGAASTAWLQREAARQQVQMSIAAAYPLQDPEISYLLTYQEAQVQGDQATVKLLESRTTRWAGPPPVISNLIDLAHTITLQKIGRDWKIVQDQYLDETLMALWVAPKDELQQNVQANLSAQSQKAVRVGQTTSDLSNGLKSYSYDRAAAQAFANNNAGTAPVPVPPVVKDDYYRTYGKTYPGDWPQTYRDYDTVNCTNFVSQAIFAGTRYNHSFIDLLYPGYGDNFWYYKFAPQADGSVAWINTGGLYTYLTGNTVRGPYGYSSGRNVCNLHRGDVVFLKAGDQWKHAVIVIKVLGDCHNPANILVASHDPHYSHGRLSDWSAFEWFAVTILGYRE